VWERVASRIFYPLVFLPIVNPFILTFLAAYNENPVLFQYLKRLKPLYVNALIFNQQVLITDLPEILNSQFSILSAELGIIITDLPEIVKNRILNSQFSILNSEC
ncbi:hypothetical protein, partial [Okeania sp. SIO3I5]|uniref:hypothetical protein n=1 Tax=Okeania sp. SIO3I5 TaxID=2607805 RepID=UPI0025DD689C